MSIDRLYKAASAAGFAMATPEDAYASEFEASSERAEPESRVLALAPPPTEHKPTTDAMATLSSWLKGFVPGFGGRMPA